MYSLERTFSEITILKLLKLTSCVINICESEVKVSYSAVSNSLRIHGLQPARPLCPWDFLDKNAKVGSHSLLQEIFPIQGSNRVSFIAGRLFTI